MKIIQDKNNSDKFKVESTSAKGKFYNVNISQPFCDCPRYLFHEIKVKGECKHILAARAYAKKYNKGAKVLNNTDKILALVKEKGDIGSMELINMFSEDEINHLIKKGDIIEQHGRIRLL
jgi:predicted nucleic acid-binding Zn finger protein